jgi:hypothetical protein
VAWLPWIPGRFCGLTGSKVLFVRSITSCAASYVFRSLVSVTFITYCAAWRTASQFVEFAEPAGGASRRKSSAHHSKFRGCYRNLNAGKQKTAPKTRHSLLATRRHVRPITSVASRHAADSKQAKVSFPEAVEFHLSSHPEPLSGQPQETESLSSAADGAR